MIRSRMAVTKQTPVAPRAMVVAEHPLGAEVGARILVRGTDLTGTLGRPSDS